MNNTLDLKFKIKLDNDKKLSGFLRSSGKEIDKLSKGFSGFGSTSKASFASAKKSISDVDSALEKLGAQSLSKNKRDIQDLKQSYTTLRKSGTLSLTELLSAHKKLNQKIDETTGKKVAIADFDAALEKLGSKSVDKTRREIANLAKAYDTLKKSGKLSTKELAAAHKDYTRKVAELNGKVKKQLKGLGREFSAVKSLAIGFFSVRAAAGLASDLVGVNIEMETLRAQLRSITGSDNGAKQAFGFIQKFAKDTPFQVQGLTKVFIDLKNFGIEPTTEVMNALTNQASKLGASQETLTGITRAFGQANTKGKLQAEEMLQLAERGVPVYKIAAQALGKTAAEIQRMATKGEIGAESLAKIILKMGELSAGSNSNAMETLGGKISNLSDAWVRFQDTLLGSKSEGLIKSFVSSTSVSINAVTTLLSDSVDDQITVLENRINTFRSLGSVGGFIGDFAGFDINLEKNRLAILLKQRKVIKENAALAEKQRKSQEASLKGDEESANKASKAREKAVSFARQQARLAEAAIASLERELALRDDGSAKAAIQFDITKGALKNISNAQKQQLLILAEQKDAIKLSADEYAEYNDIIEAGVGLAKQQRDELGARTSRLNGKFNADQVALNSGIADIADALALGIISAKRAKIEFDKLGKAYNETFLADATKGTNDLSFLVEDAAQGMQGAFADFLFDPFSSSLDDMLNKFIKTITRMAAEQAAIGITNAILGKSSESNTLGASLGGVISGLFHDGGTVGSSGKSVSVNPLVFAGAQRFHGGGYPGLKPDEIPIIAQRGERVLSRAEVANGANGAGSQSRAIIINMNINGNNTNASDLRQSSSQLAAKAGIAVSRAQQRNG